MRELNPEAYEWGSTTKTNYLLTDIFNMLAQINANVIALGEKKPAKKIKPKLKPGQKDPDNDEKHIGTNGLPPKELRKWIEEKRAKHARNSSGHNNCDARPKGRTAKSN